MLTDAISLCYTRIECTRSSYHLQHTGNEVYIYNRNIRKCINSTRFFGKFSLSFNRSRDSHQVWTSSAISPKSTFDKMNKGIILIVFPCLLAFVLIQTIQGQYGGHYPGYAGYSGYGGYGGYGGYQAGAYASNARENMKTTAIFSSLIGFFVVLFLFNRTGQILG